MHEITRPEEAAQNQWTFCRQLKNTRTERELAADEGVPCQLESSKYPDASQSLV